MLVVASAQARRGSTKDVNHEAMHASEPHGMFIYKNNTHPTPFVLPFVVGPGNTYALYAKSLNSLVHCQCVEFTGFYL